jgi:hypothetical protein
MASVVVVNVVKGLKISPWRRLAREASYDSSVQVFLLLFLLLGF